MSRPRATARLMIIRRLLEERSVRCQEDLMHLLAERGHRITQATVSRDLAAVGATKVMAPDGGEHYVLPAEVVPDRLRELARRLREFVVEMDASANLVVLKTPPAGAAPVAAALDAARLEPILGTLSGDDTVLVIARNPAGGAALAQHLQAILET